MLPAQPSIASASPLSWGFLCELGSRLGWEEGEILVRETWVWWFWEKAGSVLDGSLCVLPLYLFICICVTPNEELGGYLKEESL